MSSISLSAKDLSGISDLMSYEYAAVKKCAEMAQSFTDPQLADLAQKLANQHYKRFSSLLAFMQKN